jgi:hypothetical protein
MRKCGLLLGLWLISTAFRFELGFNFGFFPSRLPLWDPGSRFWLDFCSSIPSSRGTGGLELTFDLWCASWWLKIQECKDCSHGNHGSPVDFHGLEIQDCRPNLCLLNTDHSHSMIKVSFQSFDSIPVGMLDSESRISGLSVVSGEKGLAQELWWETKMEHGHVGRCPLCETYEIQRILRRQEACLTRNRNTIISLTDRVQTQEETRDIEAAFMMETLHSQKYKIEELQAECAALRQMVEGLVRINSTTHSIS